MGMGVNEKVEERCRLLPRERMRCGLDRDCRRRQEHRLGKSKTLTTFAGTPCPSTNRPSKSFAHGWDRLGGEYDDTAGTGGGALNQEDPEEGVKGEVVPRTG